MISKKYLILLLMLVLALMALPAFADEHEEEELPTCDNPKVVYLMSKTDATCEEILELFESGVGFGEMMKAIIIAEGLDDEDITWEDILAMRQEEEVGWGQVRHAFGLAERFSDLELTAADILALKTEEGLGWGNIVKILTIASSDLGVEFEEALEMIQSGMGWGEIRDALELPPGPPPWAGQGALKKNKENGPAASAGQGKQTGRPDWAGPKKGGEEEEEPEAAAPETSSPTAGPAANRGQGNGNGQGNSNGQGNGNGNGQGKGKGKGGG